MFLKTLRQVVIAAACLACPAVAVAASKGGQFSLVAEASGPVSKLTLDVQLRPAPADLGKSFSLYIVALVGNQPVSLTPAGAVLGVVSPFRTAPVQNERLRIIDGLDLSGLACTQLYAGYGSDLADMLASASWSLVYTVPEASSAAPCQQPSLAPVSGLGMVEGYVYSKGGQLLLSDSATPPAGASVVAGAQVSAGGSSGSSDASGAFLLRGLAPGGVTLAASANGFNPVSASLTVFGDTLIRRSSPAVSRATALESVNAAIKQLGLSNGALVLGPSNPLPSGTQIAALLAETGQTPFIYSPSGPQWFFFADPTPEQRFSHPVSYYFVDANSGAFTARVARSRPLINRVVSYENLGPIVRSEQLARLPADVTSVKAASVQQAFAGAPQDGQLMAASSIVCDPAGEPITYALLVKGFPEDEMQVDIDRIKKNLPALTGSSNIQITEMAFDHSSDQSDPAAQLTAAAQKLYAKMRACDTFFVYIDSHGEEPVTEKVGLPIGEGGGYKVVQIQHGNVQLATKPSSSYTNGKVLFQPEQLALQDMPACRFIGIVDSCYSGAWIPIITKVLTPKTGLDATFLTSTDDKSKSVAWGSWDPRGPTGGVFTTALINALNDGKTAAPAASDPPELSGSASGQAFIKARNLDNVSTLTVTKTNCITGACQKPQFWVRPKLAGETCGPVKTACVYPATPVQVAAAFTNGSGSCGANSSFNDSFTIRAADGKVSLTESNGSSFGGTVDSACVFTATRGSSETMAGTLQASGGASGKYSYTNAAGCKTTWDFSFSPK
ncbi:hypothetical protein [Chitinimonas sp.]|uniref:hypothetical protein n=1 Tax=Chitinimonas sp. TaxID=1934313 RepID=UPI0035B314D6